MSLKRVFFLIVLLSMLVAIPSAAQDDGETVQPIVPDNVQYVGQLRILSDVRASDAAWSPAGNQLAIATVDGLLLCQCDTFENPALVMEGINAYRLAWSPDGTRLAVGTVGHPSRVILRDMATDRVVFDVEVGADVLSLDFSPNGDQIAAGLDENQGIALLSAEDGSELMHFEADIPVTTVLFTPRVFTLLYPSSPNILRRQALNNQPIMDLPTTCTVTDLAISPDETRLVASTKECCVDMIDLRSGEVLFSSVCGQADALDFNHDGSLFVTGNRDGTLHFMDAATGDPLATLSAHGDQITRVNFHPDGTRLVTVSLDNTVRVFGTPLKTGAVSPCGVAEIPEGDPVGEIVYHAQPVTGGAGRAYHVQAWCGEITALLSGALYPAWSPDGTQIAFQYVNPDTGELDGLWLSDADGSNLRRVPGTEPQDRAPSWSPDGDYLAFESVRDGMSGIYLVSLDSGEITALLVSDKVAFERPVWSPDGESIAYIARQMSLDGDLRRLHIVHSDGTDPTRVTDLDHVLSADWSPDGAWLAIAAERKPFTSDIVLVDLASGETQTLTEGYVDTLPTWSPDQIYIAFVRGDTLMMIRADGVNEHIVSRQPDTFGSTGMDWKESAD